MSDSTLCDLLYSFVLVGLMMLLAYPYDVLSVFYGTFPLVPVVFVILLGGCIREKTSRNGEGSE